jgi:flagellar biosynthesis protein FlhG
MHDRTPSPDQAERLRKLMAQPRLAVVPAPPQPAPPVPTAAAAGASLPSSGGLSVSPVSASERTRGNRIARAIAVSSGKGGVGKTNLAVNLAVALASGGSKVVLLDADLGLANADVLCGITPRATLEDVVSSDRSLDEVMVTAPGGFSLVPGASGVSRLADMGQTQRRSVLDQLLHLERTADVIVVDTGAGIGANSMAFAAAANSILVACTPEPTSIADAYGAIKTLVARGCRDGLHLVVNMAMSEDEARAVHARIDRVARAFLGVQIRYAGSVPLDPAVPAAVRRRIPFSVASPTAPASIAVRRLASALNDASHLGVRADFNFTDQRKGFLAKLARMLAKR